MCACMHVCVCLGDVCVGWCVCGVVCVVCVVCVCGVVCVVCVCVCVCVNRGNKGKKQEKYSKVGLGFLLGLYDFGWFSLFSIFN